MSKPVETYCQTCKKNVKAIPKMFGVLLCPSCGKILASDIPMSKV